MIPRVIDSPPAWADWPDDRVHCSQCRNKSNFMCAALKTSCVPPGPPHRCDRFSKRVEFKGAA